MTDEELKQYMTMYWNVLSTYQLSLGIGKCENTVRNYARKMGLPPKKPCLTGRKHFEKAEVEEPPNDLKDKIFAFILKSKKHIGYADLTDKFDCGMKKVKDAIEELKKENKSFVFRDDGLQVTHAIEKSQPSIIGAEHLTGKRIRFGFVTDNHLGSKYERLDVLNAVYDRFAMDGITTVYNAGNVIDGEARFNKFDIHKYGMQAQCDYFAEIYPKREGMTTFYITGDRHDCPL